MELKEDQLNEWRARGCLHLQRFFDPSKLAAWTDELAEWPETPGRWMKYFEPAAQTQRLYLLHVQRRMDSLLVRVHHIVKRLKNNLTN